VSLGSFAPEVNPHDDGDGCGFEVLASAAGCSEALGSFFGFLVKYPSRDNIVSDSDNVPGGLMFPLLRHLVLQVQYAVVVSVGLCVAGVEKEDRVYMYVPPKRKMDSWQVKFVLRRKFRPT
jgi:hypothetical protein